MYDMFLKQLKISKKKVMKFTKNIIDNDFILCTIHRASNVIILEH